MVIKSRGPRKLLKCWYFSGKYDKFVTDGKLLYMVQEEPYL